MTSARSATRLTRQARRGCSPAQLRDDPAGNRVLNSRRLAYVVALAWGVSLPLGDIRAGAIAGILLLPASLRGPSGLRPVQSLLKWIAGVFIFSSCVGLYRAANDGATFDIDAAQYQTGVFMTMFVGVLSWKVIFERIGAARGLLSFAAGTTLDIVLDPPALLTPQWASKYRLGVVLGVLLMYGLGRLGRVGLFSGAIAICLSAVWADTRSLLGMGLVAALLAVIAPKTARSRWTVSVATLAAASIAMLGIVRAQDRFERASRIEFGSDSVSLGDRDYALSFVVILKNMPFGHGIGIVPSPEMRSELRNYLGELGANVESSTYIDGIFFQSVITGHSVVVELVALAGLVGLAFTFMLALRLIAGAMQFARDQVIPQRAFAAWGLILVYALWASPSSALIEVAMFFGLVASHPGVALEATPNPVPRPPWNSGTVVSHRPPDLYRGARSWRR